MVGFRFPLLASAVANVHEWFDESAGKFRIEVKAHNPLLGPVFGYIGWFDAEWQNVASNAVPASILPQRIESRV